MTITIVMAAISYWAINNLECFDVTLLPWNIEVAMLAIPFYAAGHWIVKAKTHQGIMNMVNSHKITTIVLTAVFAYVVYVGSQYNGSISFGHADLGKNVFVTYGCGLAGTLMWLIGCILLADTKINKAGVKRNYSAPIEVSPIGMTDHLTVLQQQELHCISIFRSS